MVAWLHVNSHLIPVSPMDARLDKVNWDVGVIRFLILLYCNTVPVAPFKINKAKDKRQMIIYDRIRSIPHNNAISEMSTPSITTVLYYRYYGHCYIYIGVWYAQVQFTSPPLSRRGGTLLLRGITLFLTSSKGARLKGSQHKEIFAMDEDSKYVPRVIKLAKINTNFTK